MGLLRPVGFVPVFLSRVRAGAGGDTHKLDDAYPIGAGKLVGGTPRDRPNRFVPSLFVPSEQAGSGQAIRLGRRPSVVEVPRGGEEVRSDGRRIRLCWFCPLW